MLGCEDEADITCGRLLPMLLLTMEGATTGRFICEGTPPGPNRVDTMRVRSVANLCLAFSTCSHSLISKVSTSANCFSFSSNLFNCCSSEMVRESSIFLNDDLKTSLETEIFLELMHQVKNSTLMQEFMQDRCH